MKTAALTVTDVTGVVLSDGSVAIIDAADEHHALRARRWYAHKHGYAYRPGVAGESVTYLHRLIAGAGEGEHVDHTNGDSRDNRRANLRLATVSQNMSNARKRSDNRSGFKGVSWHAGGQKWQASIQIGGKSRGLGLFVEPRSAAHAYDTAAIAACGEFAMTNARLGLL